MNRGDVYARVTAGILERLAAGVAPWHKPWNPVLGRPQNYATKRPYTGINALSLGLAGRSPYWLTFHQVKALGLWLRKGSRGLPIIFAKPVRDDDADDADQESTRRFMVRTYTVFNALDVEDLQLPEPPAKPDLAGLEAAQRIVAAVRPSPYIVHGNQACFDPALDAIELPHVTSFKRPVDYYATALHELTHWSGHATRLNRDTMTEAAPFGSPVYSQEELVAEMGAGFLCALAGIDNATIDASASYLDHWLKVLKADPGMLVRSAAQAQRAVDFLVPAAGHVP